MLASRIIPVLLRRGQSLVKGESFESWRSVGHALQSIRIYQSRDVDELIVMDVGATPSGRGPDIGLVRAFAGECFMPVTIGGGVRSCDDIRDLLANGADKVALCTVALGEPGLIDAAARRFGSQAVVISIDVRGGHVYSRCGREVVDKSPVAWARECEGRGAGEILLTSIEREGTLQGYDLDLIEGVASSVGIPVIASGGCGTYEHMAQALRRGAHAVAAGAMWHFTDATPKVAARYLAGQGFSMRVAA
jgi:cyclase